MKKFILVVFAFITAAIANAQLLGISGGVKLLNIKKGSIYFVYVDESPVPDRLETLVTLNGNKLAGNLAIDLEGRQGPNKPYWILRAQGYAVEILGGDIGVGIGYDLSLNQIKRISLRPELTALVGYNKKNLGTLEVTASGSVYIQVNSTRYGNYEDVDVSLQNLYYGIRPGLSFSAGIGQKSFLRIYGGYLVGFGNSKISFKGKLANGEEKEEFEKLKDRNLHFDVNGQQTQKAPFNASGLEVRLGIFFPI